MRFPIRESALYEQGNANPYRGEILEDLVNIDFVSLWELVNSIALKMQVEEHVVQPSLNAGHAPGAGKDSDNEYLLAAMKVQRQRAIAADLLGRSLGSGPREVGPEWVEYAPTGGHWATLNARVEGLDLLGRYIRGEQEDREARRLRLHQSSRWGSAPVSAYVPEMQRFREIGFERGDLVCFLDERKIPHSLGDLCPIGHARHSQLSAAPDFREPLRDELREAWVRAIDKNDYKSLFKALIALAEDRKHDKRQPLRGYLESQRAVAYRWIDKDSGDEVTRHFTEEHMRGRMRDRAGRASSSR